MYNTLWIPTQPCRTSKSFFVGTAILTGNEFGVPLAEEQPEGDGSHEEVGEVAVVGDFLSDGREGVGNARRVFFFLNAFPTLT